MASRITIPRIRKRRVPFFMSLDRRTLKGKEEGEGCERQQGLKEVVKEQSTCVFSVTNKGRN